MVVSGAHGGVHILGSALGAGHDDHAKHQPLYMEHEEPGHAGHGGQDLLVPHLPQGGEVTNREENSEWNQGLGEEIRHCKTSKTWEEKFQDHQH